MKQRLSKAEFRALCSGLLSSISDDRVNRLITEAVRARKAEKLASLRGTAWAKIEQIRACVGTLAASHQEVCIRDYTGNIAVITVPREHIRKRNWVKCLPITGASDGTVTRIAVGETGANTDSVTVTVYETSLKRY